MLTFDEAKNSGLNRCVELLGKEFVKQHTASSCVAYGKHDNDNVFCFVGIDDNPQTKPEDSSLTLTPSTDAFPYKASCIVSQKTGKSQIIELIKPRTTNRSERGTIMLKEITLWFENLESFTIPAKTIGNFDIRDTDTHISRIACNAIEKMTVANSIVLEVFNSADAPYEQTTNSSVTWFSRIVACNDITSIELTYRDGKKEEMYVKFDGEYRNSNQSTLISDLGNLYIVIHPKETVETIFDDTINNSKVIEFRKQMLDDNEEDVTTKDRVSNEALFYTKLWAATMVDLVEEWLDEKGVKIPNQEHESEDYAKDGEAHIYGLDFDIMCNQFENVLEKVLLETGMPKERIIKDKW